MDAFEAILTRRSTRKYAAEVPEKELIEKVIEAGRYAPSGGNSQTTHFLVITDPEVLKDILWSRKSRKDMMASLGMSQAHFQMVLAKLKESGVLQNGHINPRYIPHKTEDPRFLLQIVYDWSSQSNPIRNAEKQD